MSVNIDIMCINAGNKISKGIHYSNLTPPVSSWGDKSNRPEVKYVECSIEKECNRIVNEINSLKEES